MTSNCKVHKKAVVLSFSLQYNPLSPPPVVLLFIIWGEEKEGVIIQSHDSASEDMSSDCFQRTTRSLKGTPGSDPSPVGPRVLDD